MIPGKITMAPILPLWLILILLGLGWVAVAFQYRRVRSRLAQNRAVMISLLRLGSVFLLILLALNPVATEQKEHRIRPTVAVLMDTSPSMGFPGQGGKGSRLEEAKEILFSGPNPLFQSLAERFDVRLYTLDDPPGAVEPKDFNSLKPGPRKAELAARLGKLALNHSMAILLSDGNFKGEIEPGMNLPLIAIPVGDAEGYQDILIQEVKAPPVAFRGREVTIEATIRSYGREEYDLPVLLREGAHLLKAKNIRLPKGQGEVTVSFTLSLEEVGPRNLTVFIPPQLGESTGANNRLDFSLQVVRDKIRVLMVSGSPSMNYRYMRIAFKNDPTIDLLSFVILRTPRNIMNVPIHEQSLIPFPVDTLFSKEIRDFDLLIFENFYYPLFLRPTHLENVREFVKEGGALAVIGGPNFAEGGLEASDPIDEILPVRFLGKESYRRGTPAGVTLTRAGRAHPLTRFSPMDRENLRTWQEMPPLDGVNRVEPKPRATTLLEKEEGAGQPLLLIGRYGQGRTLALVTDDSWKWYAGMIARGEGNWAYLRFMDRLVRWLTKDPSLEPIQLTLLGESRIPGEKQEIKIQLREEGGHRWGKAGIRMAVRSPQGSKVESQLGPSGQAGDYLGSFVPDQEGIYKVRVETPDGSWEKPVVIAAPIENRDAAPAHNRLQRISASTGGKALSRGDEVLSMVETLAAKKEKRLVEENSSPLWANFIVLGFIVALLSAEWYWRRKWGLV